MRWFDPDPYSQSSPDKERLPTYRGKVAFVPPPHPPGGGRASHAARSHRGDSFPGVFLLAHFNKLSSDGLHWVGEEDGKILLDGHAVAIDGIQPNFHAGRVIYSSTTSAALYLQNEVGSSSFSRIALPAPCNWLEANGTGWLAWMPTLPGYALTGQLVRSEVRPALTPSGNVWVPPNGAIMPRATWGGEAAIQHPTPPYVVPVEWAPWKPVSHLAIPVATPVQPWVVRVEEGRLVAHPKGERKGIVIATGDTHHPDAVWCQAKNAIAVVFNRSNGETVYTLVDIGAVRQDLILEVAPPPARPPEPPAPMPDFSAVFETAQRVGEKFARPLSDGDRALLLNEVAWLHRGEGWGLSGKPGGRNILHVDGKTPIAEDILHHKPTNQLFDVIRGTDDAIVWQPKGAPQSADRVWVAPVGVVTQPPVEPLPPVMPPPPVPPPATCQCDTKGLEEKVSRLHSVLELVVRGLIEARDETFKRLYEMEQRLAADADAKHKALVEALSEVKCRFPKWR